MAFHWYHPIGSGMAAHGWWLIRFAFPVALQRRLLSTSCKRQRCTTRKYCQFASLSVIRVCTRAFWKNCEQQLRLAWILCEEFRQNKTVESKIDIFIYMLKTCSDIIVYENESNAIKFGKWYSNCLTADFAHSALTIYHTHILMCIYNIV